jgi:YaiO family outer membrane protein
VSALRLLCVLCTLSAPLSAATELALSTAHEDLDAGLDRWRTDSLDLSWRGDAGAAAWLSARSIERFASDDEELAFGLHRDIAERTGISFDGSRGGDGGLLPERSWRLGFDQRFAAGWGVSAGWKDARYTNDTVQVLDLGAERYLGDWRFAWTLYRGRVAGLAARGTAQRLALDRYYGDGSRVGLSLALGSEVERIGAATALVTDVQSLGLGGRHWFGPRWGAVWRIASHEQGTLYTRTGIEVGILARF